MNLRWSTSPEDVRQRKRIGPGLLLDLLLCACVSAVAAALALFLLKFLDAKSLTRAEMGDFWFDADIPRVFGNLTDRFDDHYRTAVHPLVAILFSLPIVAAKAVLGINVLYLTYAYVAAGAAGLMAGFYLALRLIGLNAAAALLFCGVLMVSSGFVFWAGMIELYVWGGASVLAGILVAFASGGIVSQGLAVLGSAASLSVTMTNWIAGIAGTLAGFPLARAVRVLVLSFCLVAILTPVQYLLFSRAGGFLKINEEKEYVGKPEASAEKVASVFFVHALISPQPRLVPHPTFEGRSNLSFQVPVDRPGTLVELLAVASWMVILICGIYGILAAPVSGRFRTALAVTIAGQFALHLFYGNETFLYVMHFAPLLVLLGALGARSQARLLVYAAAATFVVCGGYNNFARLAMAKDLLLAERPTQRDKVLQAMASRPGDAWPRGAGHFLVGRPGDADSEKAYVEPGGSFSPGFGSFGVAVQVTTRDGTLHTSDTLPLSATRQVYDTDDPRAPGVTTTTGLYNAHWTSPVPGVWRLNLRLMEPDQNSGAIVLRSVGPAGGPLNTISADDRYLVLNDRWRIRIVAGCGIAAMGEEGEVGWRTQPNTRRNVTSSAGWAFARLDVCADGKAEIEIKDTRLLTRPNILLAAIRPLAAVETVDADFAGSFSAQQMTLLASLAGSETRPGEPYNYPLTWQRDAAYIIVALLRAGQVDVARRLVQDVATRDFFGGFGAEADAPGLALWALAEVARAARDAEFDEALWHHIERKADFILRMLAARSDVTVKAPGPVVPRHKRDPTLGLVSKAARDGLIVGRMDWHYPLLYVNAVSYRGLLDAAAFARRIGRMEQAERWAAAAADVQRAWLRFIDTKSDADPDIRNERTFIAGLWPSGIAAGNARYAELLGRRPASATTNALWTYFAVAEAHQWLLLDQPQRVWATLRHFWARQPAPGIYALWEGDGEENTFGLWPAARGWVQPNMVTPHYWSAAEMLLLQINMLVHVDDTTGTPTIVVGAGVPVEWLAKPIAVPSLVTHVGPVAWRWDGSKLLIQTPDKRVPVRLGGAFPSSTPVEIVQP